MGSFSHLRIGQLNVDWSKNWLADHSVLFSKFDYKKVTHHYADDFTEDKPEYSRKLALCKSRLELIGYTEDRIKKNFSIQVANSEVSFSYEILSELIMLIDISKSIYDEDSDFTSNTEFTAKIINVIKRNEKYSDYIDSIYEIGDLLDNIDGYSILMLFILNDIHTNEDVVWEYYDLVDGGWISEEEVELLMNNNTRYLLITEGSSDTQIIKCAIEWIYPDIAGFFEFIDMDKNYPFTGVGNIVNFYHGICKIGSSKNIIFIFDNDTAGNNALNRCTVNGQPNLKLAALPSLDEFKAFKTIGPSGEAVEDINEKAVSIEMFLDLDYKTTQIPTIRWTSYDEKSDKYQGSLIFKEKYSKHFFNAFKERDKEYSLTKLKRLLDNIIDVAKNL